MHLITSPEFLARFPEGKRIVFVGNAPSLLDERLGSWIDDHDIVIRFNEAHVAGFEESVGERTDILVANPYPENRRPLKLADGGAVVVISPQTRRPFSADFKDWVRNYPVLFTYTPDIVQVGGIDHVAALTTGTYGIHLLTRILSPSHVSLTGFTMFLQDTAHHYWSDKLPKGLTAHDAQVEATIFVRICNSIRCNVEVTSEIQWVARRTGAFLHPRTKVRPLASPKWTS